MSGETEKSWELCNAPTTDSDYSLLADDTQPTTQPMVSPPVVDVNTNGSNPATAETSSNISRQVSHCDPHMETECRPVVAARLELRILNGNREETKYFPRFEMVKKVSDSIIVGRLVESDVRVNSKYCSREQFRICFRDNRFVLVNVSQTTPTRVNDVVTQQDYKLDMADVIEFDTIKFKVRKMDIGKRDDHSLFAVKVKKNSNEQKMKFRVHLNVTSSPLPATPQMKVFPHRGIAAKVFHTHPQSNLPTGSVGEISDDVMMGRKPGFLGSYAVCEDWLQKQETYGSETTSSVSTSESSEDGSRGRD